MKRYDAGLQEARRFIAEEMGEIVALKAWYCDSTHRYPMTDAVQPLIVKSASALKPKEDPKADLTRYYMLAHGCHLVDTARYFAGDIVAVNARLSRDKGMHCWFVDVEFASGTLGHLDLTVAVRMDWHEGFQIYGQNGSVIGKTYNPWYYKTSDVDIFRERDGTSYRVLGPDGHFYRRQLEGFAARHSRRGAAHRCGHRGWRRLGARHARHRAVRRRGPQGAPRRGVRAAVMQIGVFAKTFPGTTPEAVLRQSRGRGLRGRAIQHGLLRPRLHAGRDRAEEQARAVAAASAATGQQIFAVSGTYNMIHPDPAVRRAGERRLAVIAAACREMGTSLVTLCTGTRDPEDQWRHHPENASPEAWRDLLQSFEALIRIAETHGIMLGVEPELGNVVSSAAAARRLIEEIDSNRIGIVLDPANLRGSGEPDERRRIIEEAVDMLADRIVMAHAKDRSAEWPAWRRRARA